MRSVWSIYRPILFVQATAHIIFDMHASLNKRTSYMYSGQQEIRIG